MFARIPLCLSFLGLLSGVTLATPPACLLQCVNTATAPGDLEAVCKSQAIAECLSSTCQDVSEGADAFSSICTASNFSPVPVSGASSKVESSASKTESSTSKTGSSTSKTESSAGSSTVGKAISASESVSSSYTSSGAMSSSEPKSGTGTGTGYLIATGTGSAGPSSANSTKVVSPTGPSGPTSPTNLPSATATGSAERNGIGSIAALIAAAAVAMAMGML